MSNTHPKSHSRAARASALHLAQHHVHFGVKHCISSGFSLGQPCWGFSWLYVRWDLRQGRMEETLPSKPYCHPAPASAPLRHCPTKSSAAVIAGKKKKARAVHAGSSSACNDCRVMDLHGDNFELLSALKPCSLLCAGNEMCWLPVSHCRCWLERGWQLSNTGLC